LGKYLSPVLEIPTTLPTLDELLGTDGFRPQDFTQLILARLQSDQPQVLTIHAEVEGGPFIREFAGCLKLCRQGGVEFFRLEDWARELLKAPEKIPVAPVNSGRLPGRAGTVSCQGPVETGGS
jgi:undecaprenyl phosphate-alpha-L-ara4FN deformylase